MERPEGERCSSSSSSSRRLPDWQTGPYAKAHPISRRPRSGLSSVWVKVAEGGGGGHPLPLSPLSFCARTRHVVADPKDISIERKRGRERRGNSRKREMHPPFPPSSSPRHPLAKSVIQPPQPPPPPPQPAALEGVFPANSLSSLLPVTNPENAPSSFFRGKRGEEKREPLYA